MSMPWGYPQAAQTARAWRTAAERDLTSRRWTPTGRERRIAADVALGTQMPSTQLPPHTDEVLWWRMRRIALWPPVIRLGLSAGGRPVVDETTLSPPPPLDGPVDLAGLLGALYAPARLVEMWHRRYQATGWFATQAEADAAMIEAVPEVYGHVADAEDLYSGIASAGLILYVIATGDVDD